MSNANLGYITISFYPTKETFNMKIHDYKGFPNPARVRIALAEKGATDKVEFVHVDVMKGEHRLPAFVSKNPNAAVPVLELDDGTFISECTAITEYIDHAFEGISLTGTAPKERAVIHMMQRRAEQGLMDAVGTYFHHATPGLGAMETYQNKDWGMKQHERALSTMQYFNGVLAHQPFAAGENFSVADITLFVGLSFADFAKITIPAEYTSLTEWRSRMAKRPSMGGSGS
jgi:glutathione S-transferase